MAEGVTGQRAVVRQRRTMPAEVGQMISAARMRAGLRGREAERLIGISPGYLVNLESGRRAPSRTMVGRLDAVLRFTPEELAELLGAAVDDAGSDHPARRVA